MIPTKICGITHLADAQCAANHGASAIGFIFYNKSPRYISTEQAKDISDQLPIDIAKRALNAASLSGVDTIIFDKESN